MVPAGLVAPWSVGFGTSAYKYCLECDRFFDDFGSSCRDSGQTGTLPALAGLASARLPLKNLKCRECAIFCG